MQVKPTKLTSLIVLFHTRRKNYCEIRHMKLGAKKLFF